jgi:hypothetical protein
MSGVSELEISLICTAIGVILVGVRVYAGYKANKKYKDERD